MKNGNIYLLITFAVIALLLSTSGILYTGGSPGGKTGSPGDVSSCTQCHSGAATQQSGWISSNIPVQGYTAGDTYTVTVTATQPGITKFGFECTAEDAFGSKVGTFTILMGAQTKLANGNTSVTHKAAGTSGSGGSKSWAFSWTAPSTGTGTVTFYAAFNAANGNGNTSGDNIYLSNYSVPEAPVNTPPFFVSTPITDATSGISYTYNIEAGDAEGTTNLTITCPAKPSWLTFTDLGNGVASLTGTPGQNDLGSNPVELLVSDGTASPVSQDFSINVVAGTETQDINLISGWGIFSTYIAPQDSLLPTVLSSIVTNVSIVKDGDGSVYWPQFGVNTIGSMMIGKGYQIKMVTADTLSVSGNAAIPEVSPISLDQGWDIIGYLRQSEASVVTMMSPIVSQVSIVKNGAGSVYWPQFSLNMIGNMIPGEGYQIKMLSSSTLIYPAN